MPHTGDRKCHDFTLLSAPPNVGWIHLKFGRKSLYTLLMLTVEDREDALNAVTVAMFFIIMRGKDISSGLLQSQCPENVYTSGA